VFHGFSVPKHHAPTLTTAPADAIILCQSADEKKRKEDDAAAGNESGPPKKNAEKKNAQLKDATIHKCGVSIMSTTRDSPLFSIHGVLCTIPNTPLQLI